MIHGIKKPLGVFSFEKIEFEIAANTRPIRQETSEFERKRIQHMNFAKKKKE